MPDLESKIIGVTDTTWAEYDMGQFAMNTINENCNADVERYTVPGYNEQPVAAKRLITEHDCDIVVAVGMASPYSHNKDFLHTASKGLQEVALETNTHILEAYVAIDEAKGPEGLVDIVEDRVMAHTENAISLLRGKTELCPKVGKGVRQGSSNEGLLIDGDQ
ncbi:riboflavin synthase [Natrinema halophilum]|uniref:Riboflavin synthase n=1 Tax=Natrinema halophilum TaxID=1699371 RepID=A0A7D5GIJ5_9EURY|nr:riboflavin synthase [Natrinema halophilum]QLG49954.1 riboflavin synthase [Natrinema halophilum]